MPNQIIPLGNGPLPSEDVLNTTGGQPGSFLPGGGQVSGGLGNFLGNGNAAMGSGKPINADGLIGPDMKPATDQGPAPLVGGGTGSPLPGGTPTGGVTGGPMPVIAPGTPGSPAVPSATEIGNNFMGINPLDPGLTQALFSFLQSQIGHGATPFSGTTSLPTGGTTTPGQLSAPLNALMQQLQQFYSGGSTNAPGLNSLTQFATDGRPIDQTPAWQAMVDSMQRNTAQQEAQMREQFSRTGNLAGSPYGTAESDFRSQTAKDQNAQLLAAQTQAQEAAAGRRLGASEGLLAGNQAFSSNLQGLDQNAINAQLQEFLRSQPEYSPLLNLQYGAGTTFPPVANYNSGIGILGSLLQNLGGLGGLLGGLRGGGSSSGSGGGSGGGIDIGGFHIPIPGFPGGGSSPSDNVGGSSLPNASGGYHDPSDYHLDPSTGLQIPNSTPPNDWNLGLPDFGGASNDDLLAALGLGGSGSVLPPDTGGEVGGFVGGDGPGGFGGSDGFGEDFDFGTGG